MGGGSSRSKTPSASIPQYSPPGSNFPSYNISRPLPNTGLNPGQLNQKQLQELNKAYQTIQRLQGQVPMQPPRPPVPILNPPVPYSSPAMNNYPPPSPVLQRLTGQSPAYPQTPMSSFGFRETDYASIANIAGLNPADVALLHREYVNLTRGGSNRLDRVVFRQLLRGAMIEANNENIDRAIENIFVTIDRNHDGFIDFSEFIGAFRDILKGSQAEQPSYLAQQAIPNLIDEQFRAANSNLLCSPVTVVQQPAPLVCTSPTQLIF